MIERLHKLDERLLPMGGATGARLARTSLLVVPLLVAIAALADGQEPRDWLLLVPSLAVVAAAVRVPRA